jgi:DNA-binding transcriptional LysR family regulator
VLGEHSLTRAAERLATSQPTISKVLARLRGQFQDPLLVRDGQAMRTTPRAQELVAPLRALLAAADGIRHPRAARSIPRSRNAGSACWSPTLA